MFSEVPECSDTVELCLTHHASEVSAVIALADCAEVGATVIVVRYALPEEMFVGAIYAQVRLGGVFFLHLLILVEQVAVKDVFVFPNIGRLAV